ncbi:FAD-dependent oxidoreductase [Amycolatopsis benzoatilytica]|uniref:FAD-dependent oxidoreductase n=1 Tax=Amycolatopsis benzoatilytica TaxID=346045 RepID=UPI00037C09C2|nr:FAD-dependent oxidoreductase [Amycolatopsis benzoatilytica]
MLDVTERDVSLTEWVELIAEYEHNDIPIINIKEDGVTYDAIFVGGGAGGRFGGSYLTAMGGKALIIDAWPFLGGSCPHQACVPHHLFSEAAALLERERRLAGKLWFRQPGELKVSMLELIEAFRNLRNSAHAVMNFQTKSQLGVDYVLNAKATVIDPYTVEVAGRTFHTRNVVLGMGAHQRPLHLPGGDLPGVYDYATLVEDLDYEPTRCVIIGGSKVAVEYGSFFQAAGVQTTILTRSPLLTTKSLHHVDEDLRRYVVDNMRTSGIQILEGSTPIAINGDGKVEEVVVKTAEGDTVRIPCDFVYNGTGEKPLSDLASQWLGVKVGARDEVVVDSRMRTSVDNVYAIGDLIGGPMEMFKARKCGMTAARNIMGQDYEFDFSEYPDFLHTTFEVTWVGLTEDEAREKYPNVVTLQMPPKGIDPSTICLPASDGTMLYAFLRPEDSGFQKAVIDGDTRRIVGVHHVGYGAKDAFQYLDYLMSRPEGLTVDDMAEMNELFLNPEHFIQLSRLRAGSPNLVDL